jgi:hypothetical protein
MWRNAVGRGRPQTAIWRMRIACWIPKVTKTHSEYVILMAFPLHQWLHKRASTFPYTIHCLSCCCLHGHKYSHITQGLYCVQWRRIVSVGGIVTGRGIVVRFLVGTRSFDVLNKVQTHFRAHTVSCLMSTGPRFILRPRHVVDHAPPPSTEGENEKCNTRYIIVLTNINIDILKHQE